MRPGAEYFLKPSVPAQRRYEALRAYLVEGAPAAEVATRFGYSTATLHQLAAELRAGRTDFFRSSKPGPKGPRKSHTIRDRVLKLRAEDRSVTEIAAALAAEGTPASAQTVWGILHAEGLERLGRRSGGPAPRLDPVRAHALGSWPAGASFSCDHAGLYLLMPAMAEIGLDALVSAARYPGTSALSSFHSICSHLLLKCSRRGRVSNAFPLGADPGLGLLAGLTAVPKATHLTSYSYRVKRSSNVALLEGLARRCREVGLYDGEAGFNLDFHAVRHHGQEVPLEKHYVPTRSQRTRSVLTFFAQDHASTEMVYANADLTKAEQAHEVLAFAEYWRRVSGTDPGLLCFDSQLTTYAVLEELCARGITFLTLRQRGKNVLDALAKLPASAWTTHTIKRSGRYRRPQIHEDAVRLKGVEHPLRQIAIKNIGHEEPTLLITNDLAATAAKDLFARYAERMIIENELDADISGFHLNALSSGLPLNVDLDTTLTVLAGNCYRLLARTLPRYELATPDRIWRHFLDDSGTVEVFHDHVRVDLALRTYTPVLIDAGFPELEVPVPWWGGGARFASGSRRVELRQAETSRGFSYRGSRLKAIESVADRLSSPKSRLRTLVAAEEAATAALKDAGAARWVGFIVHQEDKEIFSQEKRGRPGADTRYRRKVQKVFSIEAVSKADTIAYDAATDGCFPMVSNADDSTPAQVLEIYRYQPNLERRNHMLKGPQAVAPVFIESPHRIEAILLCHFLAMLTEALIEREIRNSMKARGLKGIPLYPELRRCPSPSAPRILEIFGDAQRHHLISKGKVVQVFDPELTPLHQQVLDLLGVPVSVYASTSDS